MLLSEKVKLKWNSKIKNHYVNLGYVFTKMKDEFYVHVDDLTKGSLAEVDVECDYCHKIYRKAWRNYLAENKESTIHKDSCYKCKNLKIKDSVRFKYNCDNVFQLDFVKDKIAETNLEKYGSENPFESDIIKQKIEKTNIEKYGHKSPMQSEVIKERRRIDCLNKYGIPYMPQLNKTHLKGEQSPCWKGGADRNGLYRLTYEYKEWRNHVLQRYGYTCAACGAKSGDGHRVLLHAHHIFNFADNKDKIYDKENGICLCDKCHRLFHSIYGFRNTNNIQLNKFILNYGKKIC